jgi:hypothetical protein
MMDRLREMYKESDGNGGWQVKCKNGQIGRSETPAQKSTQKCGNVVR